MTRRTGISRALADRPGPPPKLLDPERRERFLDLIRGGEFVAAACRSVDVHFVAFYRLLANARQPDAPEEFRSFLADYEAADEEAAETWVEKMLAAPKDEWRKLAWYIERRWPGKWGAKREVHYSGQIQHEMTIGQALVEIARRKVRTIDAEPAGRLPEPEEA